MEVLSAVFNSLDLMSLGGLEVLFLLDKLNLLATDFFCDFLLVWTETTFGSKLMDNI